MHRMGAHVHGLGTNEPTCTPPPTHTASVGLTCSSSSVKFSPNFLHTLFKLLKDILPFGDQINNE